MPEFLNRIIKIVAIAGMFLDGGKLSAADTIVTNQLGQGVVYKHYHYDSLYNSLQEVYLLDINLNDPAPSLALPYLTNGLTRTVSQHVATVPGAVACVNGQFHTSIGSIQFLKVTGTVVNVTQPAVHDQQALTDTGTHRTNSIGVTLRPGTGWASLATSNIMSSGPDLIRNGVKYTSYDTNDSLVVTRNPRTCAASTYDNHLLLMVVDGRSSAAAGMTLPELRDHLYSLAPIQNAFNLDGGGSSTMWTTGKVVNVPSDGFQRAVVNAVAIVAPPPAIPLAPTNLIALGGDGQISLSWSLSSGAMSYNVQRSFTNGGPYTTITNVSQTGFTNLNLASGTTYYYTAAAVNSVGQSPSSTQASAITRPPSPTFLIAAGGTNQITLHWNSASGAITYNVKRSTTLNNTYSVIANVSSTNYTNIALPNNATFYYAVSAVNGSGESTNSSVASATTLCPIPAIPTGLSAKMVTGQIALNWNSSAGASSYRIVRSTSSSGPFTLLAAIAPNSYLDSSALAGTTYFYRVAAINSCGQSSDSTGASAPLLIRFFASGTNLIASGWGGVEGQSYYVLASTNLVLPFTNWARLETNLFGYFGYFNFTNRLDPDTPQRYLSIQSLVP